jgi:glutamate/tyrosine decarboxylase-like PLP-dependent enzyme
MALESTKIAEESLDPEDWESMRALGHRMVDDMLTYLQTVRERPLWQPMPEDVRSFLGEAAPQEGAPPEQVYEQFKQNILPYPMGNIHPRFWGWVMGTGTPFGMLAEMAAATMNPNMGGGDHAANEVEKQVLSWLKEMVGFPGDASGLLVSGGSMANLVGLTVARNTMAGYNIRKEGVAAAPKPMRIYASEETHSSVQKAAELLGLGSDGVHKIPVNKDYEIEVEALKAAIAADRAAGLQPFCVVGNAATVNTGAVDDLNALADICKSEKLWYHVDGAFGACVAIAPRSKSMVKGMERADSVAFDLHKWLYMPFEIGCTLVRSEEAHRRAFSLSPDYLVHMPRGIAAGTSWFSEYGVQLTRGFRALKAWMSFKEHGFAKYGRMIQQNIDQGKYLADLVEAAPELELSAPAPLNIVCFRYVDASKDDAALDEANREIMMRLQEEGIAAPSYTTLNGRFVLRAAITNQRSRREDFDLLVREVIRLGKEILS